MHTKSYDGFEIRFPGPDLHQGEVYSALAFLRDEIEKIDEYPDKSLFFRNPRILEGWLALVRALEKIETWEVADNKTRWEERTESNISNLFVLRNYDEEYEKLSQMYFEQLSKIQNYNYRWFVGGYIREEEMEALFRDRNEEGFGYDDDFINHLKGLVKRSIKASSKLHSVLADILGIYTTIMDRGESKIRELAPHDENFVKAIEDDLREWESYNREKMFREMKEDLTRHYKEHRTDRYTPELWSEMLDADEAALSLAKRQLLTECDEPKQEHWGENMKMQMDENGRLMQLILSSCHSDELFDMRKIDSAWQIISLLTQDNLYMFYEIIVRRSLIQCEMFPDLRKQHEEWLNKSEEQPGDESDEEQTYSIESPKINLQRLLREDWFTELRTKEEYDEEWTNAFIDALMASEWGEQIARDWTVKDKRLTLKCMIVGRLKDAGVLRGNYSQIAKLLNMDGENVDTLAKYLGLGKKQAYADWIMEYINPDLSD